MARLRIQTGNWSDGDGDEHVIEVEPLSLTDDEAVVGYEVENSPEREVLDKWATEQVLPSVRHTEDDEGWTTVYFSDPDHVLYDCEYNWFKGKVTP